ncbi:non-hydrolyzing UDP-N-acetylglucosamine 2-epimerase [Carboxylicivirga taeanensis]|uniref:non-hydrolyzing UDP-N-acetylglucosamine 2-epimerase n=1 Tax=Carboxylicivirga taeanensis TaxID=1416875 RepID=UPI003F6DACC4
MKKIKKILLVFGTRPEAIKMAPLVKEFQKHTNHVKAIVCVTAQHREMLDQVLELFEIIPEYDLNLMKPGQDLYDITTRVLIGIRDVLKECNPELVLVHGDTTTSMATALAAFYQQIPVAHIEAGLRTYNMYSPWPEEINRQITGRLTTYHFSPTNTSRNNLIKEGVSDAQIFVTGNTVIDALHWVLDKIKATKQLENKIKISLNKAGLPEHVIHNIDNGNKVVLITGHRRENFGQGFTNICNAIKTLARQNPDVLFIYPMHLNPNVRRPILEIFGDKEQIKSDDINNVYFIEPLDYLPFVYIMNSSYLILTDSGGIQEEAPSLGKPVLVMRDTTERPEAIDSGTIILVGQNQEVIVKEVNSLLSDKLAYDRMSKSSNPYGDGTASQKIVQSIINSSK